MTILLWILQGFGALVFGASGTMKAFMLEKVSADVKSFGAFPPRVWKALGLLELTCVVGLVAPPLLHGRPELTGIAALVLALETVVFVWVHIKYREVPPIIMSGLLGLGMAILAYGRLRP